MQKSVIGKFYKSKSEAEKHCPKGMNVIYLDNGFMVISERQAKFIIDN